MGGSGSGSSSFGGTGRPDGGTGGRSGSAKFDCDIFTTKATLRSPQKAVIDSLNEEDVLDIILKSRKPPILAVTPEGEIAGSIVVPEQNDLVKCINKGTEYQAEVLSIEGGTCIVEIYAVEDD